MRLLFITLLGVCVAGCTVDIPNGVFGCLDDSECPSGFMCWSDFRCYDTPDPGCQPQSCEQIIDIFEFVGVTVECGDLPDGCGSTRPCDTCESGETCGGTAGSNEFLCCAPGECEVDPCIEAGAQCDSISGGFYCGTCSDNGFVGYQCIANQCVCDDVFEDNDTADLSTNLCELFTSLDLSICKDGVARLPVGVPYGQEFEGLPVTFDSEEDADWFVLSTNSKNVRVEAAFEGDIVETFIGFTCVNSGQPVVLCDDGDRATIEGVKGCVGKDLTAFAGCQSPIAGSRVRVFIRALPGDWEPECQTYDGFVGVSKIADGDIEEIIAGDDG